MASEKTWNFRRKNRMSVGRYTVVMPYSFHSHTLPNGLKIIAEVSPEAHSASAGFFVKTGARDEASPLMGVSHFLEHMMFKGTEGLSADELNRAFDEIGARNNAFTSNEMTCFYAHMLPEHMPRGVELLSRMMRPALKQADFDTEKGVILEEIAMYQDNPFWVLYEATVEKHFGSHPLSHRVLGTSATITALKRDEMLGYFEDRYSADNTVLALAGNVDFEGVCRQVEALCGGWRPTRVSRDGAKPAYAGGTLEVRQDKVNRGYVLGMCDAPAIRDDRRYAAGMLAQILGASDNSRLHWAIIEPGLAEQAQASYDAHDGFGEFFVFAVCDAAKLEEVWGVIEKEMADLEGSLKQEDLDRLRAKLVTAATLGGERPGDRMHRLGRLWTYMGEYTTLERELEKMAAVTIEDVRRVAKEFPLRPLTVGRLLPK